MKVFNWVHRKFLRTHIQSDTSFMQEDGKRSTKKVDFEEHSLLEHDVVNNWENGFLAIGTLGIGPLGESIQTEFYDEMIKESAIPQDHDQENNHGHVDDLHNYKDDDDNLTNIAVFRHELEEIGSECKEIEEVAEENSVELEENNESDEKNECQVSKRRVTLADLFSEDSDYYVHIEKQVEDDGAQESVTANEKPNNLKTKRRRTSRAKNGFSKAKKLLKDDFRPLDMFNQLMKRMIKKKIYPDLEGKVQKDIQMQPTRDEVGVGPHKSPSLLLI